MEKLKLELRYIGEDSWGRPVYESGTGRLFKNVNLREEDADGLCTVWGGFDGEPDTPIEYTRYKHAEIIFLKGESKVNKIEVRVHNGKVAQLAQSGIDGSITYTVYEDKSGAVGPIEETITGADFTTMLNWYMWQKNNRNKDLKY